MLMSLLNSQSAGPIDLITEHDHNANQKGLQLMDWERWWSMQDIFYV